MEQPERDEYACCPPLTGRPMTVGRITDFPNGPDRIARGDMPKSPMSIAPEQPEVMRELIMVEMLSDDLGSQISALAGALDPILPPANTGKETGAPNSCQTPIGSRINSVNNRLQYLIDVVRNLRQSVQI